MYPATTTPILLSIFSLIYAQISDQPEIECLPDGFRFSMNITKPFSGKIYLRGHHDSENCSKNFSNSSIGNTSLEISYDRCQLRRKRESNPKGVLMSTVLVVSHHPRLVTHKDSAYEIHCFYQQQQDFAETNTVTYDLSVQTQAPILTMEANNAHPTCEYKVELGRPHEGNYMRSNGTKIVSVGDTVSHIWSCANNAPNNVYCIQVHSCFAEDEGNEKVEVVDEFGCVTDDDLLTNMAMESDLMITANSRAFKFADRSDIRFSCQIKLSLKRQEPEGICKLSDCKVRIRRRRAVSTVDVESPRLVVLEERVDFEKRTELPAPSATWSQHYYFYIVGSVVGVAFGVGLFVFYCTGLCRLRVKLVIQGK